MLRCRIRIYNKFLSFFHQIYKKKKKRITSNISLNKIALNIAKTSKVKYNDLIIFKKVVNNHFLTKQEIERIHYLNKTFGEERISYILNDKMYENIFNKKPCRDEVYQDIDEKTDNKYLYFEEYKYVFK